jgi:hypothetical protein
MVSLQWGTKLPRNGKNNTNVFNFDKEIHQDHKYYHYSPTAPPPSPRISFLEKTLDITDKIICPFHDYFWCLFDADVVW